MSVASPSPSPSPTLAPGHHSSPSHSASSQAIHGSQPSTKPGALVSEVKSLLSQQSARLALKHNTDLDLLDDLRLYLKNRCSIERDYAQSLTKLTGSYSKRSSQLLTFATAEDESADIKTLYTSWKNYQEELEKHAKNRLAQFEQLGTVCDALKSIRTHKVHVSKKCLDSHLKKMQEEVITSVMEIDKTRKLYFDEEHLAKQARDKEEKIKKRKTGIFSSFANLQTKKERTSAHREASDIQSTQARNDYIMALAAGNAHLEHYYGQDLPNLIYTIDDTVLDRCRGYILNLLQAERELGNSWFEVVTNSTEMMENSSADYTNQLFLRDPNSSPITETLFYEFQPCENDTIDTISLDHNADIALRNEGQKWFSWFSKECRNLNRLSAQLVRVQAMMSEGHKTVEVTGSGQVDIETRIDEIRQQIRKSEISKLKAKARLQIIRSSGAEVEDFESFEAQVAMEIKQQSLDVDLNINSLSRTPSVRSSTGVEYKFTNKSESDSAPQQRPESSSSAEQLDSPDREVLQLGSSVECTSPAPTSSSAAPTAANPAVTWDYDPVQAWTDDPEPPVTAQDVYNGYATGADTVDDTDGNKLAQSADGYYGDDQYAAASVADGYTLVGKQCYVLYTYEAQNEGDLSVMEQEIVTVTDASDKDWVQCQNEAGNYGFVPAAYLQEIPSQTTNEIVPEMVKQEPELPNISVDETEQPLPLPPPPETSELPTSTTSSTTYARAIYDYVATNDGEISFNAGEIVEIIDNSSDDGWWTGKNKDGQVGHFPSMLVCDEEDDDDDEEDDDEDDDNDEDSENEDVEMPSLPPSITLPPAVCPEMAGNAPIPDLPPPPPKPMNLIAPQTVVIIQPTPEIESRPALGSEDIDSEDYIISTPPEQEAIQQQQPDIPPISNTANNNNNQAGNQKQNTTTEDNITSPNQSSVKVSVAIAAHEVSETITQHAMDDSMRELSRRTSAASSDGGLDSSDIVIPKTSNGQIHNQQQQPEAAAANNEKQFDNADDDEIEDYK